MTVQDVVSVHTVGTAPDRATLELRPVRRLSRPLLWTCMGALAAAALAVAWLSARQGNVFAPAFAVLESVGVAIAFAAVWKTGQRGERITFDAHDLEVTAWPRRQRTRYPTGWVRVRLEPGAGRQRLLLGSHGRETEVGEFLADDEKIELARQLRALLSRITGSVVQRNDVTGFSDKTT